jgi:hypothetical protein
VSPEHYFGICKKSLWHDDVAFLRDEKITKKEEREEYGSIWAATQHTPPGKREAAKTHNNNKSSS